MSQSHQEKLQQAKQYLCSRAISQRVVFGVMPRQVNFPAGTMATLQASMLEQERHKRTSAKAI